MVLADQGRRLSGTGGATGRRRIFYWSEDTAGKDFDTGIQRVVRCLGRALQDLGVDVVPVGWDGDRRLLRILTRAEQGALGLGSVSEAFVPRSGDWLLVPEIPTRPIAAGCDPVALARAYGLRVAVLVHDLIPIKHPDAYEAATVEFYRRCYRAFAGADVMLVTTHYVAGDLRRYLQAAKADSPDIAVCPLAAQLPGIPRRDGKTPPPGDALRLLTISRWEPRKNLPRLLDVVEDLAKRPGLEPVHLTIVGQRGGFPAYEAEVEARLGRLPNVTVRRNIDDRQLAALHETHHATIYPSVEEGFGLPGLESLWLATPCLCHAGSAMAEVAPGGGTIMIDMRNEEAIADTLADFAAAPGRLRAFSDAAAARELRTWHDTARAVAASLRRPLAAAGRVGDGQLDLAGVFC